MKNRKFLSSMKVVEFLGLFESGTVFGKAVLYKILCPRYMSD